MANDMLFFKLCLHLRTCKYRIIPRRGDTCIIIRSSLLQEFLPEFDKGIVLYFFILNTSRQPKFYVMFLRNAFINQNL